MRRRAALSALEAWNTYRDRAGMHIRQPIVHGTGRHPCTRQEAPAGVAQVESYRPASRVRPLYGGYESSPSRVSILSMTGSAMMPSSEEQKSEGSECRLTNSSNLVVTARQLRKRHIGIPQKPIEGKDGGDIVHAVLSLKTFEIAAFHLN